MKSEKILRKWAIDENVASGCGFMLYNEPFFIDFGKIELDLDMTVLGSEDELTEKLFRHGAMLETYGESYYIINGREIRNWSCDLRRIPPLVLKQEFTGLLDKIHLSAHLLHGKNRAHLKSTLIRTYGVNDSFRTYDKIENEIISWLDTKSGTSHVSQERGTFIEGLYFTEDIFIHGMLRDGHDNFPTLMLIPRHVLKQSALNELSRVRAEISYILELVQPAG